MESPVEPARAVAAGTERDEALHLSHRVDLYQWQRLLVVLASIIALCALLWVCYRVAETISHTLLLFSVAGLLAYALDPLVELARRRRGKPSGSRAIGALTVYLALGGLAVIAVALLASQVTLQVRTLTSDRADIEARGRAMLADADDWLARHGVNVRLQDTVANPPPNVRAFGQKLGEQALALVSRITRSAVESIIVLLITIYLLIYGPEMRERANACMGDTLRPYAEQWEADVNRVLGGFVRGQALLAGTLGVCAAVGCVLLGLRFWLLIGLFVVAASLIPVFGPYIGAIPAIIAAALTPGGYLSPGVRVALIIVLFVALNEGGSKILYPRFVGKALGLHEVVVLFVLFAGLEVGKIWGVLFAAPVTALAIVTAVQSYRLWQGLPPMPAGRALTARPALDSHVDA